MYYAHLAAMELASNEAKLADQVHNIEQRWFSSELEVCTERNRLASRLRLVRHGQAIAGGSEQAMPPRVQADSEYAAVRYRFFDVDATMRRVLNEWSKAHAPHGGRTRLTSTGTKTKARAGPF
jgi:hypothetical protein